MSIQISIVVAVAENDVIGFDGDMPWQLSTDLKRFKALTIGKPMIMGRKTFAAIGSALPGRTSIVITRDTEWQAEGVVPVHSIETAIALAKEVAQSQGGDEICIVGGGNIYQQSIDMADVIHLTRVHATPTGDTVFPKIDSQKWQEVSREEVPAGEKDTAETTYIVYQRRR
ncbi:MAG: dihydrofolate reductase [Rhizobiaceae bacterium]|nr:dihydrofolate reductase [Hyphomicrobiales bacterium]NRB30779.1 dihydrofolate reductase [Rhizobiaceae bacterium]